MTVAAVEPATAPAQLSQSTGIHTKIFNPSILAL